MPVARVTASDRIRRYLPSSAASSEKTSVSLAACRRGQSNKWPGERGMMSRKATSKGVERRRKVCGCGEVDVDGGKGVGGETGE